MNWRGPPLTSHEVIVNTIAATTTSTGLKVRAVLDTTDYPTGVKIRDKQMRQLAQTAAGYATTGTASGTTPSTPSPAHRRR